MKLHGKLTTTAVAVALLGLWPATMSAQVVEEREGDANPAAEIFKATLYGAATGLVLGGAYTLIRDDDDPSTGEILSWSVAGGAGVGLLIGLVYVATRSDPEGSAEEVREAGMLRWTEGRLRLGVPGVTARPGAVGATDLRLLRVSF